jgi:site-specific recombinase XerD
MGRFAEERRAYLSDLNEKGYNLRVLRTVNRLLLGAAERVNVRRPGEVTEEQIVRAAKSWAAKVCAPTSTPKTWEMATRRFIYWTKRWLCFLGKWRDPVRNPQVRPQLDSFLAELRDVRGYSEQTIATRKSALEYFFEWLTEQGISLRDVSPETFAAYFVQHKARGWKKSTIKIYGQSLKAFFRYAGQHEWCMSGLAETIENPTIYSLAGVPQGPSWEQVRELIASLNTERPSHIRDRAIILLLAVYGLRIGEVCALKLEDVDWVNEKIRIRRSKNKRVQEFPLTAEVGNAILKYLRNVRPNCAARSLFLTLPKPPRPMINRNASTSIGLRIRALGWQLPHYGPHSLRHACATHLLDAGFSLKEIGDQLGHRSPQSTQIYAKVDRKKLRQVAGMEISSLAECLRTQRQPITASWAKERLRSLREVSNFRLGGVQ